jgi:hypothetical protein
MPAEPELGRLIRCLRLDLDCSEFCLATGHVVSRQTETDFRVVAARLDACATACEICAIECVSHRRRHCKNSAVACRRCQKACRDLACALPEQV